MHIAVVGTGRVGRPTANALLTEGLASELTVCDIKKDLAESFAEELKHVAASQRFDVKVNNCGDAENISGADLIVISAGYPRTPGSNISRRMLSEKNAEIVREISEKTMEKNPNAKYVVVTNPVDAMAMICKRYTGRPFVLSTGTHLESLRFRARLAELLSVPVSRVQGWVLGEHGENAFIAWSSVRIDGLSLEERLEEVDETVRGELLSYILGVSRRIIDGLGATEFGPAASFRDIVRAIVRNTNEVMPVASPISFKGIEEPVFVSAPTRLGSSIGPVLINRLSADEKLRLKSAAESVYQTYLTALKSLEVR
jgi:malate dehydrogenase